MSAPGNRVISALGVVQIFAWGSTFYLMAPLAGAISADTGWGQGFLSAGVSLGLLISGLSAPAIGRWIGRTGGRQTMSAGMLLIATGLLLLGLAATKGVYLFAWAVLGLGMAAGLYDAAFSTLGSAAGRDARAAITRLTLWGGFASTVCWPLSAWLVTSIGWQATCFSYAALHLLVTLPLCRIYLPKTPGVVPRSTADAPARIRTLDPRFICIVVAGVTLSMIATIWSIHMVTILTATGYSIATAIALGTLIGPAQVAARVLEMLGRGRHHPIWTMGAATSFVLFGFLGLQLGLPASAGLIAYGAGNGLWSIARGALPLALFGADGYAELMGRLARPMLIAGAAAPMVGAALIGWIGPDRMMAVLAIMAVIPVGAALILFSGQIRKRPAAV
ncbi:MFS transporter [Pseudooceanicola algae]|uniref:Uncharacterized protein n=1 Tax=Pseudooceanicola algae TaxID=1537215 RepID=A0A418SCT9_9RHOB|nr:MFS transporter [Pseudooceanicola algae]QPM92424.1 hypothetical protein PSAL_036880 [Pseudooceanicola algae]